MATLTKTPSLSNLNTVSRLYNPWDRFFSHDPLDSWAGDTIADTIPAINVYEEHGQYIVEMAVPGLKREDFNIEIGENMITISCDKETEYLVDGIERTNRGYARREFNYADFSRSFAVPDHTDTNAVEAKYRDGILTLTIPIIEDVRRNKSRKIAVK